MMMPIRLFALALLSATATGFVVSPKFAPTTTALSATMDRRQALMLTTAAVFGVSVDPSFADVSDGNVLPQGAAQFSRVLRAKSDIEKVETRVVSGLDEMDKKEWDNVGVFLRKLYSVGDDMKVVAGGMYDPAKKKRAAELIDAFKKVSKAADSSTGSQNGAEYVKYSKKLASIVDEFLDLLSDVPDEL